MTHGVQFFNYGTPPGKLYETYVPGSAQKINLPYQSGSKLVSDFSGNIEVIQMIVMAVITAFALSLTSAPALSLVIIAPVTAFYGYIFYRKLFYTDPLVEAFYKIMGDRGKFLDLPYITLCGSREKLDSHHVTNLSEKVSSQLSPICCGWWGACQALIIKGPENKLLVFVQNLSPLDFKDIPLHIKLTFIAKSLLPFFKSPYRHCINNVEFAGGISTDMANEFFLQNKFVNTLLKLGA
ncbi:MAG TPA: hypothetical protein VFU89_05215 [Rhabdochlamydiaceae bacterium]|nr:hypothetical protein [Rhabdochlamydiaceae bacterium]